MKIISTINCNYGKCKIQSPQKMSEKHKDFIKALNNLYSLFWVRKQRISKIIIEREKKLKYSEKCK